MNSLTGEYHTDVNGLMADYDALSAEVERLREAIEAAAAVFPVKLERQAFYINTTPLMADDDDRFYSAKKVDTVLSSIHAALAGSKESGL